MTLSTAQSQAKIWKPDRQKTLTFHGALFLAVLVSEHLRRAVTGGLEVKIPKIYIKQEFGCQETVIIRSS